MKAWLLVALYWAMVLVVSLLSFVAVTFTWLVKRLFPIADRLEIAITLEMANRKVKAGRK